MNYKSAFIHLIYNDSYLFFPHFVFQYSVLPEWFVLSGDGRGNGGASGCRFNQFDIFLTYVRMSDGSCSIFTFNNDDYMTLAYRKIDMPS